MDKQAVRKEVTEQKQKMSEQEVLELSMQLKEKFCATKEYEQASCLYSYLSFNQEVQTAPVILQALADGKRVAVPLTLASGQTLYDDGRPKRDYMEFIYLNSLEDFPLNYMGIPEPDQDVISREPERIADEKEVLILMPGLAFDREGNRIGYGGGFYDKYLSSHPNTVFHKIALCFPFQVYDSIPTEAHDEKMDLVIY